MREVTRKLEVAGFDTTTSYCPDAMHEFFGASAVFELAEQARQDAAQHFLTALGTTSPTTLSASASATETSPLGPGERVVVAPASPRRATDACVGRGGLGRPFRTSSSTLTQRPDPKESTVKAVVYKGTKQIAVEAVPDAKVEAPLVPHGTLTSPEREGRHASTPGLRHVRAR